MSNKHKDDLAHKLHDSHHTEDGHKESMASPTMAAHMEHDMRKRFLVSLGLAIPTFMIATWPKILESVLIVYQWGYHIF